MNVNHRKTPQKREHKFNLNLQSDKENVLQVSLDENSLVALETKRQDFTETPGKELFKLNHSHKQKSQVWSAKSLPLNKTPESRNSKAGTRTVSNTPCKNSQRKTPLKLNTLKSSLTKTPSKLDRSLRSAAKEKENVEITPRNTRRMAKLKETKNEKQSEERLTRRMAKILENRQQDKESEEEEELKETASSRKKRVSARSKTPMVERCQKRIKANKELAKVLESSESSEEDSEKEEEELDLPSFENYFKESKDLSKKNTSNNNLSQLPVLDPQEYLKELKKICKKTQGLVNDQKARIQQYYPDWVFELEYGFNILCYGYGSKKDVLEEFVEFNFKGYPVLKVNGFFPTLNIRSILSPLLELINHTGSTGSVMDQVGLITSYFNSPNRDIKHLILLIHNIDSVSLRNDKSSTLLSLLAECPCIYMIASVDHINAPLLWDHNKSKRFNWIWHDATSFSPWISESTFENSVLVKSGGIGPRNVICVLYTQ